ncbi:uncharacterized protein [Ptychodera flava]|uniref:uncharacterized protein n=2 Tax=Ptychodera flava TaxID=63121 RepID=UPI003969DC2B
MSEEPCHDELCKSGLSEATTQSSTCTSGVIKNSGVVNNQPTTSPRDTQKGRQLTEAADHVPNVETNISSHCERKQCCSSSPGIPSVQMSDVKYSKKDEIGRGTFGVVYRGSWAGTYVAVKQINVRNVKLFQNRVKREIEVHSRIRHPNIVQLMAVGTEKNQLYIISEYINGANLEEVLFTGADFKIHNKPYVASQLCQAVSYMHCNGIIHRDIKPANVLVTKDTLVTKVCDMGISKLKEMHQTLQGGTQLGVPGTPAYMAPECLLEKQAATPASDVWSLGVTLIELFTEQDAWNLDDDGDSAGEEELVSPLQPLYAIMKRREKPESLKLMSASCNNAVVTSNVSICLDYEPLQRPSAYSLIKCFPRTV